MTAPKRVALVGGTVHTGDAVLDASSVIIVDGRIEHVGPEFDVGRFDGDVVDLAGRIVAPGLVDLQVNGGGDALFNAAPNVETLETIASAHESVGTTSVLATFVTGADVDLAAAGAAVAAAVRKGVSGILGAHFEGPLLSRANRGVHDPALLQMEASERLFDLLAPPARSVPTMVTLAPESVPVGFIRALVGRGAVVAAGHTGADAAEVQAAVAEGLTAATHLWNGMPAPRGREPGPVPALLQEPRVRCGLIADGHHLAAETIRFSLDVAGTRRCHLVSDAMPPVGGARSSFSLGGRSIAVREGRCLDAQGGLAGAAVPLIDCVRHCVEIGVPLDEALRMASLYPAQCMGVDHRVGRIAVGRPAHLIVLDTSLDLRTVIVGQRFVSVPSGSGG
jgi:N-acetylglucosamine-6-phosphate deacetylase